MTTTRSAEEHIDGPSALLTVKEVAEHWRVTERTVRAWIKRGDVHVVRQGGVVRVVPDTAAQPR